MEISQKIFLMPKKTTGKLEKLPNLIIIYILISNSQQSI